MPIILVTLPAPLHRAAGGAGELVAEGETVAIALASLRQGHPTVTRLFLEKGNGPRRGVSLFLNGRDLRTLDGLDTVLRPGDRLEVVLLMAGG
jgi:molybdopterin synthase sulfur carrier subunit